MTKKITFGGICTALSAVIMLLSDFLHYNTVFLICAAASLFPLVKIKCGTKWAFITVAAAAAVVFIVGANKMFWLFYLLLSVYAVVKGIIESINRMPLEIFLKLIICAAGMGAVYFIYFGAVPLYLLPAGVIVFFIFDFALSIFVSYISKKTRLFQ